MGANPRIRASLGPMILVVEDEPLVSRGILLLANRFGQAYLAQTVADAMRALADTESWGAFVVDVALPDGSGIDVLSRARRVHAQTHALVLTGHLSSDVANAAFDLRASCIAKPIDSARIALFLQEALSSNVESSDLMTGTTRNWAARYTLSAGEAEVLVKAATGASRDEIAESRGSSPLTVKDQERSVREKTGDASFRDATSRFLRDALRGRR